MNTEVLIKLLDSFKGEEREQVNAILGDDSLTEKQKYLEIFKLYLDKTIK